MPAAQPTVARVSPGFQLSPYLSPFFLYFKCLALTSGGVGFSGAIRQFASRAKHKKLAKIAKASDMKLSKDTGRQEKRGEDGRSEDTQRNTPKRDEGKHEAERNGDRRRQETCDGAWRHCFSRAFLHPQKMIQGLHPISRACRAGRSASWSQRRLLLIPRVTRLQRQLKQRLCMSTHGRQRRNATAG